MHIFLKRTVVVDFCRREAYYHCAGSLHSLHTAFCMELLTWTLAESSNKGGDRCFQHPLGTW